MKRQLIVFWLFAAFFETLAQEDRLKKTADSNAVSNVNPKGFAWGGTPILAFDPDIGLKYGAIINLFDYGDGSMFPDYRQYAFIRLFNSTNGTSNLSLLFDSDKLPNGWRLTLESSYINDKNLDFWGFNGTNAIFNAGYITPGSDDFINEKFYTHSRKLLRLRFDVQKNLGNSNWRLLSGVSYNRFNINYIKNKSNTPEDESLNNDNAGTSLYKRYIEWGIINPEEMNGGTLTKITLGVSYDSRNSKIKCTDGIWFDTYFVVAPPLISSSSFVRHIATFRHYMHLPLINGILAYRITSQQLVAGKTPFYALPIFYDSRQNQDGLGGIFNMRGINRNRLVAEGFFMGNLELRKTALSFHLLNLYWDVDLSLFADAAYINREYSFNTQNIPDDKRLTHFGNKAQRINKSYGAGIYFIYNHNNIFAVKYGVSPNKQLGDRGIYISSTFLF